MTMIKAERPMLQSELLARRYAAMKDLHHDHRANHVIGLDRGPDTRHLYELFDYFETSLAMVAAGVGSAELKARNDELEAKVTELENRLASIEAIDTIAKKLGGD